MKNYCPENSRFIINIITIQMRMSTYILNRREKKETATKIEFNECSDTPYAYTATRLHCSPGFINIKSSFSSLACMNFESS